jgi:carbonic anhydrase/acetyltransferase-like protein (isoleucine patch superfamily)
MTPPRRPVVRFLKAVANATSLMAVAPAALTCLGDRKRLASEGVFVFWTHVFALAPGPFGVYLRRAFYSLTLKSCSLDSWIGFGALFSRRTAEVEDGVYVGAYAVVGSARLRSGCLLGTRANVLSGAAQHVLGDDGRWTTPASSLTHVDIGEHVWIGEGAIVMADVGAGSQIGAGSVVGSAVPAGVCVAGNPARFVRQLRQPPEESAPAPAASAAPAVARADFIDWLKCIGMFLIVYGHVAGWAPLVALAPIYTKQLGVALFLFATGYSLTQDRRPRWQVAFNRLFEIYIFGLALAVLMSGITYATEGRLQISNYAPFLGGVNIIFPFFPANPTTWFLGTYLHVVLLWALVGYRIRVSLPLLAGIFIIEIAIRAVLSMTAGEFIAYMALPNWASVLFFGIWLAQRHRGGKPVVTDHFAVATAVLLVTTVALWHRLSLELPFGSWFPFMKYAGNATIWHFLTVSSLVSVIYFTVTALLLASVLPLKAPRSVQFVARNTLLIFLAHMPVFYGLQPVLRSWGLSRPVESAIMIAVCMPGLALISEVLHRGDRLREWRDWLFVAVQTRARVLRGLLGTSS